MFLYFTPKVHLILFIPYISFLICFIWTEFIPTHACFLILHFYFLSIIPSHNFSITLFLITFHLTSSPIYGFQSIRHLCYFSLLFLWLKNYNVYFLSSGNITIYSDPENHMGLNICDESIFHFPSFTKASQDTTLSFRMENTAFAGVLNKLHFLSFFALYNALSLTSKLDFPLI